MRFPSFTTPILSGLAFGTFGVYGHSWIDNITITGGVESPDGVLGYIRGYQGHIDASSVWEVQNNLENPACAPFQSQPTNTPKYPRLTAAAGDVIMGQWLENGHISKPIIPANNTMSVTGPVYWYGTEKSNSTSSLLLSDVLQWTMDGKGGNGEGVLLSSEKFDDGVCVEPNGSPIAQARQKAGGGGACKGTFTIPEGLPTGSTYTVFWLWDFNGKQGYPDPSHVEWYTSCMDINIRAPGKNSTTSTGASNLNTRTLKAASAKFRLP